MKCKVVLIEEGDLQYQVTNNSILIINMKECKKPRLWSLQGIFSDWKDKCLAITLTY